MELSLITNTISFLRYTNYLLHYEVDVNALRLVEEHYNLDMKYLTQRAVSWKPVSVLIMRVD